MKLIRSVAVDPKLWKKFMEICRREKESASSKIQWWIAEYVRQHEPGNPQLRLDRILAGEPRPGVPPKCRFCGQPATYIQYWVRNRSWTEQVLVCDVHRKRARQAPLLEYGERRL